MSYRGVLGWRVGIESRVEEVHNDDTCKLSDFGHDMPSSGSKFQYNAVVEGKATNKSSQIATGACVVNGF